MHYARLVFLSALSLAALSSGCSERSAAKASLPQDQAVSHTVVRAQKPQPRLESGLTRVTGNVRSRNEATLSAKTTAQIRGIYADVGDRVKKGQRLAVLDSSQSGIALENARAAERAAKARLDGIRLELDRATTLSSSGALPPSTLDQIKTTADAAAAQLDQARAAIHASQQAISDSTIVAPFDGVISSRSRSLGDTVSSMPPTAVFGITDPKNMEIRMLVPEALVGFVSQNQLVSGSISPKGTPIKAKVRVLGSVIDSTTRTVEVLADVTEPIDSSLRSGLLVTIDLKDAESLAGPFLPSSSIHNDPSGRFVFVVNGENIERRGVTVASVTPGTMWVRQGLNINDLVVAGAVDSLRAGDKVAVLAD